MMNPEEFKECLDPMAQAYGSMNPGVFNIYYDILKKHSLNYFRKAVYTVLEFHKYKNWPPIGVFSEAIEDIKRDSSAPSADEVRKRYDIKCDSCNNIRWIMTQKPFHGKPYNYLIYCQCPVGHNMKAAHEEGKRREYESRRKN